MQCDQLIHDLRYILEKIRCQTLKEMGPSPKNTYIFQNFWLWELCSHLRG